MSIWETKAAILETLNAYSGSAGRLDIEAFVKFFTDDAEVHGIPELLGQTGPLKGPEQIAGFFGPIFANLDWLQQQNTTTDITVSSNGKSAKTCTGLVEKAGKTGSDMMELIARYDDELVLTDAGWRFKKRVLTPYRFGAVK